MTAKALPLAGLQKIVTFKISDAVNDNDVGKPVKISASDAVSLCADGDPIYGFITSIEVGTEGGLAVVGVMIQGRHRVTLSGAVTIGAVVEAAAQTAAGSAKAGNWAPVSTHTPAAGEKNWILISGAGTDGTDGTVEYM